MVIDFHFSFCAHCEQNKFCTSEMNFARANREKLEQIGEKHLGIYTKCDWTVDSVLVLLYIAHK